MYNTPQRFSSPTSLGIDERWERVLCYAGIWVTGLAMLLLERRNANVRQHAKQSVVIFGGLSLIALAITVFSHALGWIPLLGFVFSAGFGFFHFAVITLMVVLWVVFMILALVSPQAHVVSGRGRARF